jgi:hypothetical protein
MKKKSFLTQLFQAFLGLVIFLTPTNLFVKFFVEESYVKGLLVDYLIPKIYLSDFFVVAAIIVGWKLIPQKKRFSFSKKFRPLEKLILWLVAILLIVQVFTPKPLVAFYYLTKVVEMILLAWTTKKLFSKLNKSFLFQILSFTIIFQSSLAVFQFATQKPLLGYYFLGEPDVSQSFLVAKSQVFGQLKTLPYGTTTHPNVLAGAIVIFWLITYRLFKKVGKNPANKLLFLLSSILGWETLFLTGSISAILSLIIGGFLLSSTKQIKRKLLIFIGTMLIAPLAIELATHFIDNPSIQRRSMLNKAAYSMILNKPIVGVGINNFTARLEHYSNSKEVVRFVQPVHHLGLLLVSETGLLGITILILIFIKKRRNINQNLLTWLLILSPLMSLDHYLATQQIGLLLGVVSFSFFSVSED